MERLLGLEKVLRSYLRMVLLWLARFEHLAVLCNLASAVGRMNVLTIAVHVLVEELEGRS
jgi:hypothetical protein